jgi:hypothetical protein
MRRSGVVVALLLLAPALAGAATTSAGPDVIDLPTPEAAQVQSARLIVAVGGRPDRLLASDVPGPVINDEVVRVALDGDGAVRQVLADQRLRLTGTGDYAVRERGPARSATSLTGEPPPVTRRGAVVWQGFSPGSRDLAARLTLDPQIEATRLPLTVSVTFNGSQALRPGGRIPGAGRVTVTVSNVTEQPQVLPSAADVSAELVAKALDRLRARKPTSARLPATGTGFPASVPVTGASLVSSVQAVPYFLRGALTLIGTTGKVTGPATTPTADGARLQGTLGGSLPSNSRASVSFVADVDGPGELRLDLTAVAALNPAELAPPKPFTTWAAWAAAGPDRADRRRALDLVVAVAATGARASSYSPYLGADLQGNGSTEFRYAFAPEVHLALVSALHPRWARLALVGLALLLIVGNSALIWRRL